MNPSKAKLALEIAMAANVPAMMWGAPGVGKSETVFQVADEHEWPVRDIRLSQLDPVDLRGVPSVENGFTLWNIPNFLPDPVKEPEGIMFLDEINQAPASVQAAAYQLVLDRKIGDYELPHGWRIITAGNRASDRALTNKMSSALSNRLVHIDFEPNLNDWVDWANKSNVRSEIVSFMRFRPEMLHDHNPSKDARSFPTPRTWSYASRILNASASHPQMEYEMLTAAVGEGAASEFMSYIRIYRGLPTIEQIEKAPTKTPVPDEPATLYATSGMLGEHLSDKNITKVSQYLNRLPSEFQVPTVKMAIQRNPDLLETKEMSEWVSENTDILL